LGACIGGGLRLLGAAPRHLERFLGRFGAPVLRKVATWSTVSVIAFGAPALATPGPQPPGTDAPGGSSASEETTARNSAALVDLGWGARPADPGGVATRGPTSGSPATDPLDETAREHVVEEGEPLWAIAEADLRRSAPTVSSEEIAVPWPNGSPPDKAAIGADPIPILPLMILHAPPSQATCPPSPAPRPRLGAALARVLATRAGMPVPSGPRSFAAR